MTREPFLTDPKRGSVAEHVAEAIERRIGDEHWQPGHRIGTREELRREFDVAVSTINEAVRLLTSRGTVTVRTGAKGGIFVAAPTAFVRLGRKMLELSGQPVEVADCLTVRDLLEPQVIRDAARHRSDRDVQDLHRIVDRMEADIDISVFLRINWEFHRRMALITPNEMLRSVYIPLLDFVQERLRRVVADDAVRSTQLGHAVHRRMVTMISEGDPDGVERVIAEHAELTDSGVIGSVVANITKPRA